ncbi:unnamed protein product [Closterium sp. NIES-65]|nr:unnamed protein product [Closterium sp. NIES-65]
MHSEFSDTAPYIGATFGNSQNSEFPDTAPSDPSPPTFFPFSSPHPPPRPFLRRLKSRPCREQHAELGRASGEAGEQSTPFQGPSSPWHAICLARPSRPPSLPAPPLPGPPGSMQGVEERQEKNSKSPAGYPQPSFPGQPMQSVEELRENLVSWFFFLAPTPHHPLPIFPHPPPLLLSSSMQSVDELRENLNTYREQLEQVSELLIEDPDNDEYKEMASGLKEVIELTEDLLSAAEQQTQEEPAPPDAAAGVATAVVATPFVPMAFVPAASAVATTDPAALAAVSSRIAVGTSVQAVWGVTAGTAAGGIRSSEWLDGVVDSVTTGGYVVRDAGGQMHEVRETRVRRVEESEEDARKRAQEALAAVEREADETRRALKRKMEEASRTELVKKEIPLKLRIKPEDSEDVKVEKKRKIHAFKSKQRMEMLEVMTNKKQNTWQQFQTKGIKRKAGFLTGRKKESIFKSPEDVGGKVGVVGSGQGMTDFQKRDKNLNLRAQGQAEDD